MRSSACKRILVPTDGSPRALRAARVAAALARKTGARLTALYVLLERVPTALDAALYASPALSPELQHVLREHAERALRAIERVARRQGVACERVVAHADHAWKSIVGNARRRGCDLIVMASRGRDSGAAALLGSETTRVLAHSKIPVLVCR
jgi:nucleotide-binding universal stress UspA family protein